MILRSSMKNYRSYWRSTVTAAIAIHFVGWMGVAFILPKILPEPKLPIIDEIEWIDVSLAEESVVEAAELVVEEIPEPVAIPDPVVIPELYVAPYVVEPLPELPKYEIPEPAVVEKFKPDPKPIEESIQPEPEKIEPVKDPEPEVEKIEAKVEEPTKDDLEKLKSELESKIENKPESNVSTKQQMIEPPIVLNEVYPPKGGIQFGGYVSVAATIGTDGTVKKVKVMRKSGRILVDNVAMNAAKQWTFKPAIDQNGKPMECDRIITFDFRKLK